ncbi:YfhO family protein [Verrucomicrobia bacterium]|nr:YfhO family protein [Verrucomicrobiota bacterium]
MPKKTDSIKASGHWWKAIILLSLPLLILFRHGFVPEMVLFSNDGPLGVISASAGALPGAFFGYWHDLNWVGMENPSALPDFSMALGLLTQNPIIYSKIYAPVALLFLGFSAWMMGRSMKWNPWVCVLVGLAAALNSNAFSNACWGLPSRATTMASVFLALAAIHASRPKSQLLRYLLAGFAIGHSVLEGFDVGALYSIGFGLYVVYLKWTQSEAGPKGAVAGLGALMVIVFAAGWMASQGLITLVGTQLSGAAKPDAADPMAKEAQWNFATQWSMPVNETIRLFIPGVFGYRMTDLDGTMTETSYWGGVGRDPLWKPGESGRLMRHSGSGEYAGVLVVIVALWAFIQTFRSQNPIFEKTQKSLIRFWSVMAIAGLFFSFGRHAPFYQIIYQLPFIHSIRNPIKFMHLTHLALIILFGYGLQGLYSYYLASESGTSLTFGDHLRKWWKNLKGGDRSWTQGYMVVLGISIVAWLIYASSRSEMNRFLLEVGIPTQMTDAIHAYSAAEVGMFVFWMILSGLVFILILSRYWSGKQTVNAFLILGVILVVDLCRANVPWIQYYDYQYKYATHPVLDIIKENPQEGRVTSTLNPFASSTLANQQGSILPRVYNDWLQHAFPFYNVQSLDVIQWPRPPKMDLEFGSAFAPQGNHEFDKYTRLWELTSTRYIFGMTGYLDYLNTQFDPEKNRFKLHTQFNFAPKPGKENDSGMGADDLQTVILTNGPFAIFEFTGAFPRAKLYNDWRKPESDQQALSILSNPDFDPAKTALISEGNIPEGQNGTTPGNAEITSYEPKKVTVKTSTKTPALLVLNDRHHPNWKVSIDGKFAPLLRCNHLMRGVFVPEGEHEITFEFAPSNSGLYAGLFAWISAIGILGVGIRERTALNKTSVTGASMNDPK